MGLFNKRTKPARLDSLDQLAPMLESGKPVLLDFFQFGCGPCQIMDGVINELADEYAGSAHVVKVNVARVPGAVQMFSIRSTPTFVLLGGPAPRRRKRTGEHAAASRPTPANARWRASGLVKKDFLARQLESSGAVRAAD